MALRRWPIRLPVLALALTGAAVHVACGLFVSADDYDRDYGLDAASDGSAPVDAPVPDASVGADTAACAADTAVDPLNCGACGRSCAGRACSGGRCATANAYAGVGGTGIALGDAGIYIATLSTPSALVRLAYDLVPGPIVPAGDLAFAVTADDAVYWTDVGGVVRSVSLDMGPETIIGRTDASAAMLTKRPLSLVYWTVRATSANGGGVYSGLGPNTGARMEPADEAFGIVDDDTYVYYGHRVQGGTVTRRQKAGSESVTIATANGVPIQLAADDFNVYFTDCAAGSVISVAKDGSARTTLASGLSRPYAIAVDRDHVYVSLLGANLGNCLTEELGTAEVASVERITKSTRQRLVLADKQTAPLFLAIRADSPLLYWTSAVGAKAGVWNVPK